MKNIEKFMLYTMIMGSSDPYDAINYDDKVDECLMNMYYFMISGEESKEKREKFWQAFVESYDNLNCEQQDKVKQDYLDIINAQNKNDKVKKKGYDIYE